MARKPLVPPGPKRGGAFPFARGTKGKGKASAPPVGRRRGVAVQTTLPSPPPRPRATRGMGPPVQNPLMRTAARGPMPDVAEERIETAPTPMGAAMSAGVGASPRRRALANAMRGGRMAF